MSVLESVNVVWWSLVVEGLLCLNLLLGRRSAIEHWVGLLLSKDVLITLLLSSKALIGVRLPIR